MDRRLRVVADGFTFLESPRFTADGRLRVSDMMGGRVLAFAGPGRRATVEAQLPDRVSGTGSSASCWLLAVDMRARSLVAKRHAAAPLEHVLTIPGSGDLNDLLLCGDDEGYLGGYGSDLDAGAPITPSRLLHLRSRNAWTARETGPSLVFPNGMALDPMSGDLVVAETFAGRVVAVPRRADGSLGPRASVRADWSPPSWDGAGRDVGDAVRAGFRLPDGIDVDGLGRIWVSDANGHEVVLVSRGGTVVDRLDTAPLAPYAVALHPDGRTLAVCVAPPLRDEHRLRGRRAALLLADLSSGPDVHDCRPTP